MGIAYQSLEVVVFTSPRLQNTLEATNLRGEAGM